MSLVVNNLVGFGAGGGALGPLESLTFQSVTSSTSNVLPYPSTQAGDLLILWTMISNITPPTSNLATGFTAATNSSSSTEMYRVDIRVCDGTETGNVANLTTGDSLSTHRLFHFRPNRPIQTATVQNATSGTITAGDPAAITITSGSGAAPLAAFGLANDYSFGVAGYSFSPTADYFYDTATRKMSMKFYADGATPANCSVDSSDNSTAATQCNQGFYLEFT